MSKHNIKSKRAELAQREAKIKSELEKVSDLFERKTKQIILISAIGGVVILGAYGIFKLVNKSIYEPKKNPAKLKKSFSLKKLLIQRATSAAVNYAGKEFRKLAEKEKKK